jgi:hypothetical protein
MRLPNRKQLCSWILAIAISLFSFVDLGYGEGLKNTTRSLSEQTNNENSVDSNNACLNLAAIPGQANSPYLKSMLAKQSLQVAQDGCVEEKTLCRPCQTITIICEVPEPDATPVFQSIRSNKKNSKDNQPSGDTAYVRYNPNGVCELHLSPRYFTWLQGFYEASQKTCMQQDTSFQSIAPRSSHQMEGLSCGATVSAETIKDIFAFNLGAFILEERECLQEILCVLANAIQGEKAPGDTTCNLTLAVEALLQHYQSLSALFDELYHILQSGKEWCTAAKPCLEYHSGMANLKAHLAISSLMVELDANDPGRSNEVINKYCADLMLVSLATGIEKCICDLERFSKQACNSCAKQAQLAAHLPKICNILTQEQKAELEEYVRESYTTGKRSSHNCGAYQTTECARRFCPDAALFDPSCIEQNWPLIEECINTPCNNHCPNDENPNQCCTHKQGCYKGECANKLGCKNCTENQRCEATNIYPYYACKDL